MRRKEDLCQEYIGQINQEIKDISEFQGPLIESLKQSVEEYLVEHPNATLPDLYQRYGAPHEIAKLSVQQVDSYKLLAKLRKQRIARLFFLTIACLFIAFFVLSSYSFIFILQFIADKPFSDTVPRDPKTIL